MKHPQIGLIQKKEKKRRKIIIIIQIVRNVFLEQNETFYLLFHVDVYLNYSSCYHIIPLIPWMLFFNLVNARQE